ncbi:MAG TPA: hypothetical protein VJS92_15575 [Candidatus Polarisedimenticolaceae bacterium]|nr:hypothetical protein [Candidatus Polarisedimenticolaceae bacterium]
MDRHVTAAEEGDDARVVGRHGNTVHAVRDAHRHDLGHAGHLAGRHESVEQVSAGPSRAELATPPFDGSRHPAQDEQPAHGNPDATARGPQQGRQGDGGGRTGQEGVALLEADQGRSEQRQSGRGGGP